MVSTLSRRDLLRAGGATAIAATAAGCTSSVPFVGDESPCDAFESYMDAAASGDAEAAVDYMPYAYVDGLDREDLLEEFTDDLDEEDFEYAVDCLCEGDLDDDEIDELPTTGLATGGATADLGSDHAITAATEVRFEAAVSMAFEDEVHEETFEDTETLVEIDGDGWYAWPFGPSFDAC